MSYPDTKETWERAETNQIIPKEHPNGIWDFLERLQDVLGLSIKKGYGSVSLLLDYLKTEADKVVNKLDKTNPVAIDTLNIKDNGATLRLQKDDNSTPFQMGIQAPGNDIQISLDSGSILRIAEGFNKFIEFDTNQDKILTSRLMECEGNVTFKNEVKLTNNKDLENDSAGYGIILKTPDGTNRYKITIDNSGNLVTTLI